MTRSFCVALLLAGMGWTAFAQDPADPPPADPPAADTGVDLPATDPAPADPALGVEPANPGIDPLVPGADADELGVEPADPGFQPADRNAVPPTVDPGADTDAVRPGESLEGAEPLEPGLPGSPLDPDVTSPRGVAPDARTLPDTILDATPVPENDLPPSERNALPATEAQNADGLGAPLIEEGRVPETAPPDAGVPPVVGDPRLPIERQPLPVDPDLSEPLVPNADAFPPPAARRRPVIDPAYGAPAPPQPRPQVEIDEVVRNPVRVYETRLLVMMGHGPAADEAIDVLSRRFPTDARVPYLRFFHLSRKGEHERALDALRQAVAMERLYPVTDYNRFMEPLQGQDRYYAERVRRATAELAAADGLLEPDADALLEESLDAPVAGPPLPARPSGRRPAPPPEVRDDPAARSRPVPGDTVPRVEPGEEPVPNAGLEPDADAAPDLDPGTEPLDGGNTPGI